MVLCINFSPGTPSAQIENRLRARRILRGNRTGLRGHTPSRSHTSFSLTSDLVEYRREICACGLVVEADGHEGHRLHDAQAVFQAPPEKTCVSRGDENAGTHEEDRK